MIKIAIADDHKIFLEGLSSLIARKKDIQCVGLATNAAELIQLTEKHEIDIAILDISMPDIDGIELSKILKKRYPKIKTLILSSYRERKRIQLAIEAGVSGYVLKENGQEELEKAILRIHEGREFFSEPVMQVVLDILRNGDDENTNTYRNMLTERETEVLKGIVDGLTTPDIAKKLFISESTVSTHRKNIHSKFNVNTMNQLIRFVRENDILEE